MMLLKRKDRFLLKFWQDVVMDGFFAWSECFLYIIDQKVDERVLWSSFQVPGNSVLWSKNNPAVSLIFMENIWSTQSSVLAKSEKGQWQFSIYEIRSKKGLYESFRTTRFYPEKMHSFINNFWDPINTGFRILKTMVNFIQI